VPAEQLAERLAIPRDVPGEKRAVGFVLPRPLRVAAPGSHSGSGGLLLP
jgi:hypothetical protein